jgi:hypothetical protein
MPTFTACKPMTKRKPSINELSACTRGYQSLVQHIKKLICTNLDVIILMVNKVTEILLNLRRLRTSKTDHSMSRILYNFFESYKYITIIFKK